MKRDDRDRGSRGPRPLSGDSRPTRPARAGSGRSGPGSGPGPRSDRGPSRMGDRRPPRYRDDERGPPRRDSRGDGRPARFRDEDRPSGFGHVADDELRYVGRNACLALFRVRPKDIVRVYVHGDLTDDFADLLNYCVDTDRPYKLVGDDDLARLTDSTHHQGVCVVAKARMPLTERDFFHELGGARTLVLYLDGVGNPHNLGAIMRSAAHFGLKYVAGPVESLPRLSPALCRVAEGAAESVLLVPVEEPETFLDRLKHKGFQVYAFENREKAIPLYDLRLSERAVFVLGAEVDGVSNLLQANSDVKVKIPGTGEMESLNVSVAAAVAMAEFHRQGTVKPVRIVKKPS